MRIDKGTINASPFVGIFAVVTERIALLPYAVVPKEQVKFKELFDVEIIKTKLADSSLLGVMCAGISDRFVVSELALDSEIEMLKQAGLHIKRIGGLTAIGNLLRVNESGGIASRVLTRQQLTEIESFLKVKLTVTRVASLDIVGSAVVATDNGFIAHPNTLKEEFSMLKKSFGVDGIVTTLNYGDKFVGNDAVANSRAMLVGNRTTAFELLKINDFFA